VVTGDPPDFGEVQANGVTDMGVPPPGASMAGRTFQRRTTQRIAASAAIVAILGGVAGVLALHRHRPHSADPRPARHAAAVTATPSPTGSPSPDPTPSPRSVGNPLAKVDWANATLPLPPGARECSAPSAHFHGGSAHGPGEASWQLFGAARGTFTKPLYADLLGDATPEAIVEIDCTTHYPVDYGVVVYTAAPDGSPTLTGIVTSAAPDVSEWIESVAVKNRVVSVQIRGDSPMNGIPATTTIRNMVWSVSRFVHLDPKLAILDADPLATEYTLPPVNGCPAYAGPLPQPQGKRYWGYGTASDQARMPVGDLDGDGTAETLSIAECAELRPDTTERLRDVLVALKVSPSGKVTTMATVEVEPDGYAGIQKLSITAGTVRITYAKSTSARYRWTGEKFVRS
jgi:hypothetical protein